MASCRYLQRKRKQREQAQARYSRAGVLARERKKQAEAAGWHDVGGFVTDGCLGEHRVRLLCSDDYSERVLAVTVDGEHRRPRTLRGVEKCMARMVARGNGKERA